MPRKVSRSVQMNLPLHKGQDYTGKKIGAWTILAFHEYKKTRTGGNYTWLCRCDCGVERPVGTSSLLYGTSDRCIACRNKACLGKKERNPNWKGFGEIPGEVLNRVRGNCKRARILEMNVDCEYLDSIWKSQNRRCFYSGRPLEIFKTASLDRIDSSKGYVKGNVQWVHIDVNRAKWEMSPTEFIDLCVEVAEHNAQ